jgi:hypothetical protein
MVAGGGTRASALLRLDAAFRRGISCQRRDRIVPGGISDVERAAEKGRREVLDRRDPAGPFVRRLPRLVAGMPPRACSPPETVNSALGDGLRS